MRLKNVLIVVQNIDQSKKFYREMFGLDVVLESDGNIILTEGLVLQEKDVWEECIGKEVLTENNSGVLYFEEKDIEKFAQKLEQQYPTIQYVHKLTLYEWGQKVMRFYDLDGNLIEVRTPNDTGKGKL